MNHFDRIAKILISGAAFRISAAEKSTEPGANLSLMADGMYLTSLHNLVTTREWCTRVQAERLARAAGIVCSKTGEEILAIAEELPSETEEEDWDKQSSVREWTRLPWTDERWIITDRYGKADLDMIIERPAAANPMEKGNPFTPWGRTADHVHLEPHGGKYRVSGIHARGSSKQISQLMKLVLIAEDRFIDLAMGVDPTATEEIVLIPISDVF